VTQQLTPNRVQYGNLSYLEIIYVPKKVYRNYLCYDIIQMAKEGANLVQVIVLLDKIIPQYNEFFPKDLFMNAVSLHTFPLISVLFPLIFKSSVILNLT